MAGSLYCSWSLRPATASGEDRNSSGRENNAASPLTLRPATAPGEDRNIVGTQVDARMVIDLRGLTPVQGRQMGDHPPCVGNGLPDLSR